MADDVAERLIEALYAGSAAPAGCRVNHARGVLAAGTFRARPEARRLCRATVFDGSEQPVAARFSSSGGDPAIDEDDAAAEPRGLALCIGDELVLVGHSVHAFPARTPDAFLAFVDAINRRHDAPERLERHLAGDAAARGFLAARRDDPSSFATRRYHMLHAFRLTDANGRHVDGRLVVEPAPDQPTACDGARPRPASDRLTRELVARLAAGPVALSLSFAPAHPGDALDDMATPWPDRGDAIVLGTVALQRVVDDPSVQRRIVFDPARLPAGLAFAGDPMIAARLAAYRLAFRRRTGAPPAADADPCRLAAPASLPGQPDP